MANFQTGVILDNSSNEDPRRRVLASVVGALLQESGFHTAEKAAVGTLTEMLQSVICEVGKTSYHFAEVAYRTQPVVGDIQLAFAELGVNVDGINAYAKRSTRTVIPSTTQQVESKQYNVLQVGDKQLHPSHIPDHFPPFPDTHTYCFSHTYKQPVTEYEAIREKSAQQKRDIEKALTKFAYKTNEVINLLTTEDKEFLLVGIKCNPKPYLDSLMPRDQVFEEDEEFEAKLIKKRKMENEEGSEMVPKSEEGWKQVAREFEGQWNFPNCVGSADGKHIAIQKPPNSGSYYYNYKGSFSIVLMAIVNAKYQFLMVDVGANGRVSDGGVLKNTLFWRKLCENQLNMPDSCTLPGTDKNFPYVFIGDEAFQLLPNFMKPYGRVVLTDEKRIFNYRLSRARRVVENVFGILTKRFKVFQKDIKFEPHKVRKIVLACCHLHNYLCSRNRANYLQPHDVDNQNTCTGTVEPGSWRQETQLMADLQRTKGNAPVEAKKIRDDFCEYFNTCGAVSWQNKCLNN